MGLDIRKEVAGLIGIELEKAKQGGEARRVNEKSPQVCYRCGKHVGYDINGHLIPKLQHYKDEHPEMPFRIYRSPGAMSKAQCTWITDGRECGYKARDAQDRAWASTI